MHFPQTRNYSIIHQSYYCFFLIKLNEWLLLDDEVFWGIIEISDSFCLGGRVGRDFFSWEWLDCFVVCPSLFVTGVEECWLDPFLNPGGGNILGIGANLGEEGGDDTTGLERGTTIAWNERELPGSLGIAWLACCVIGVAVWSGGDWGIEGNKEGVGLVDLSVVWDLGGKVGLWDGWLDDLGFSGLTGGCVGLWEGWLSDVGFSGLTGGCGTWEGWLSDPGFSGLTGGCEEWLCVLGFWGKAGGCELEDSEECGTSTALNCGWFEWFEWFEWCEWWAFCSLGWFLADWAFIFFNCLFLFFFT